MSKKKPKIPDPIKALPFPGLTTGAFSLQRAVPARTITTSTGGGGRGGFINTSGLGGRALDEARALNDQRRIAGVGRTRTTRTTTVPSSGPFQLLRTDPAVPAGETALLGRTQQLLPQVQSLRPTFTGLFGQSRERLEGLLSEVTPGFGRVTDARVAAIDRNRSRTLGSLREAFGKRNVLGASFAQGEIRRADQEFTQLESEARAESAVQEIELSQEIIGNIANIDAQTFGALSEALQLELATIAREQSVIAQRAQRELEELRIAGGIITQHTQTAANLATAQAQLAGQAQADQGSFFGSLLGFGSSLALGGVFGGPSGAAAAGASSLARAVP